MCSTLILLVAVVCVNCECVRAVRAAIGILPSGTTNSDGVVTSPSYVDRSRSTNRRNKTLYDLTNSLLIAPQFDLAVSSARFSVVHNISFVETFDDPVQ